MQENTDTFSWISAYQEMRRNFNLTEDAIGVFAINLRFDLDDVQTIASEAITGGGDDKKCDIVYVDKEKEIAVIAQCYVSQRQRQSAPANKAADLNAAISWLFASDINSLPPILRGRADELRSSISSGEIKQIYIWYIHNCPASTNVQNELKTASASAYRLIKANFGNGISVIAEEIDANKIEELYRRAEQTIIITDTVNTRVVDAIEIKTENWTSIATVVKGSWLRELYLKYKTDLFSANLREYLGSRESDSNINNSIKTTATKQSADFFIYNNGITALILDYELGSRSKAGRKIKIKGISIVNGAQTTGSLGSLPAAPAENLQVAIRFIKIKNEKNDIISNVIRFNNSQNKLQAADFRSTDPIQQRLRTEFRNIPDAIYDGGRRGGAGDTIKRNKFALPAYTVGQSLAAFHGDPVTAYDKKSELWTNEISYRRIFTDNTSAYHITFCYSLLTAINEKKLILTQKQKENLENMTEIEKNNLKFLTNRGANYLLIYVIAQCMETIISKAISNKFNLRFKKNISPSDANRYWLPIVDLVLSLSGQLDGAFSRNRITNENLENAVRRFTGVMASLAALHKKTFEDFSSLVEIAT